MPTRPRVLLVDDHPGILKALHRMLLPECDVIGLIADGREVADVAARAQPLVIVMDLNLPKISGLDVCREITQSNLRVKVIVITAMTDEADMKSALAVGASDFLDKAAPDKLIVAIKRIWMELTSECLNER
jgi:CheY-like chemotaxis protein